VFQQLSRNTHVVLKYKQNFFPCINVIAVLLGQVRIYGFFKFKTLSTYLLRPFQAILGPTTRLFSTPICLEAGVRGHFIAEKFFPLEDHVATFVFSKSIINVP
jgi:hypothetical protein